MECNVKKYTGLIVLSALVSTSFLAVKAAPDERGWDRKVAGGSESQIGQLDKALSVRIDEQNELLSLVEKLLKRDFQQSQQERSSAANVLSGQAKPTAPKVIRVPQAKVINKAVEPPWWQEYKPQMVYLSGNDRYAVISGKMYLTGQILSKGVLISSIEEDSVVLRFGGETHSYPLKK
jgi:hypothetical protein